MAQPLDAIIRKDLLGSRDDDGTTNYETINADGNTIYEDVSGSEQGFLVSVTYANGVTPNVEFALEGSLDGISFGPINTKTVTDDSGSHTWDIAQSNSNFVRVAWTVSAGSVDIYVQLSAKRRH